MNRVITEKRVRRKTLPLSSCCMESRRSAIHCSLPRERKTALYSTPSCTCIWMRLSFSRISRVMRRRRLATNFPRTMASGVKITSAQASHASKNRMSKKAPNSWIAVTTICGNVSATTLETESMSFERREVTSPEWSSFSSKRRLEKSFANKFSLSSFDL